MECYTHFDLQRTDIGKQTITTGQLLAILLNEYICTFHFNESRVMNCEKMEMIIFIDHTFTRRIFFTFIFALFILIQRLK